MQLDRAVRMYLNVTYDYKKIFSSQNLTSESDYLPSKQN